MFLKNIETSVPQCTCIGLLFNVQAYCKVQAFFQLMINEKLDFFSMSLFIFFFFMTN